MQPYQAASEKIRRHGELPIEALKTGASIAASAASAPIGALKTGASIAAGGIALKRILPLLSKYIPQDLAIKGLNKLSPHFGNFINKSLQEGASFDTIRDFLRGKAEGEQQKPAQETRNVIEQYSPDLHQFIASEVSAGRPVLEAGALAQANPKFKTTIKQIEKDNKANWSAILQSIYGGGQYGEAVNPQQVEQSQAQSMAAPQAVQGNNDAALMAALDKILKM